MNRPNPRVTKTKRLNIFLNERDAEELRRIAEGEDRLPGYAASWFIEWGIKQYNRAGASFKTLREISNTVAWEEHLEANARLRLALRKEARNQNGSSFSVPQTERRRRASA